MLWLLCHHDSERALGGGAGMCASLFGELACGLTLIFGLSALAGGAVKKPSVELTDEGLPLQEIRPLDRHVYILTLEGKWNRPGKDDTKHYVNILFPSGQSASHRVLDEVMFRKGEVRCVLQEYELVKNDVAKGGDFVIVVSEKRPVNSQTAPEVISDALKIAWPLDRPVLKRPPRTRHSPPPPIDALPLPDDSLLKYAPDPAKVKPPAKE
jgi:hypothetical protein